MLPLLLRSTRIRGSALREDDKNLLEPQCLAVSTRTEFELWSMKNQERGIAHTTTTATQRRLYLNVEGVIE